MKTDETNDLRAIATAISLIITLVFIAVAAILFIVLPDLGIETDSKRAIVIVISVLEGVLVGGAIFFSYVLYKLSK